MVDAIDTFVNMQRSAETKRAYAQDLRRWQEWAGAQVLTGFDANTVVAFRDHLSANLSPRSAARVFSTIRTFYRWAVAQGLTNANPFEGIKGPKVTANRTPRVPDDADVEAVVRESMAYPRWRVVVALLLNGLRASEVGSLRIDDIGTSGQGKYMKVIGKGQRERLVPLTSEAEAALYAYWNSCDDQSNPAPFAVGDVYGKPLSGHAVRDIVYDVAGKAKVKGMHPHALRHHYATRLIRAGANIMQVRDLLGHTSVNTTQVYVTLDMNDLFEAARLDPRNQKERLRAVS